MTEVQLSDVDSQLGALIRLDAGERISIEDMKRIQANTQLLDAELMTRFLFGAWEKAQLAEAPPELVALAADAELAEAIERLSAWDFSTPTGIPEGYDASDVDGVREPLVSRQEADASVAATLYSVWRGKLIENTTRRALIRIGIQLGSDAGGGGNLHGLYRLLTREPFTGVGLSGLDFFPEPAGLAAEERRDVVMLRTLRDALDRLAGDAFAEAFGRSTDQDEYRWGRLNRVLLPHPLGSPFSIPPAAGFEDLSADLPGISHGGGFETVDLAGTRALTQGSNDLASRVPYRSSYRLVMSPGHPVAGPAGVLGFNSMPGGSSGDAESPLYASQLAKWLTVDYHHMLTNPGEIRHHATKVEGFAAPRP